ncbi:OPT oligopeptide transporter [Auriculariales sp. MPI-PUGE-AT-0066]|nr:OPT oligopeptide transporter [Auriculariales sp. MPI-PUGE-AT-0066]
MATLERATSHDSVERPSLKEKLEDDVEKNQAHLAEVDVPEATGAAFDDPNLDKEHLGNIEDDSPYPVVPGLNQFFYFRYPSVTITGIVAQLLSFPMGRAWAAWMPNVRIGPVNLNPGPFTIKDHGQRRCRFCLCHGYCGGSARVLQTAMELWLYAVSSHSSGCCAASRSLTLSPDQWMIVMSTQLIGFSIGGIARRFLVDPPSMIWPASLVNTALFNTLHQTQYAGIGDRGGMSREWFFFYAFLGSCVWYFFPGYIFQALGYFSWVCWIAPDNVPVNQMFGYFHGMGMSLITFDWSQIAYIGSPLATPWWAEMNVGAGFLFFFWFLTPILHYTNTWYAEYMPISSRTSYDNTAKKYNVSRILNEDATLNMAAYKAYSPLFLSTTFALSYGLSFASITSTLVPEWWYVTIFLSMFAFGLASILAWPSQFPWYAFIVSLIISFFYVIPIGMIQAITNQQVGLNVITELVIGYWMPGRPVAMMMFKTWGYITMAQALTFTSDFKLGHYMKVAPRAMFFAQVVCTIIAGTVQLGVQAWMFTNIEGMCEDEQKNGFICPNTQVFGTASIIWGVIGPALQFSHGQIYYGLVFFFLAGALAPVITYYLTKLFPNSPVLRYLNWPVLFSGTGFIPPASAVNYVPWTIVGFIFQYVIRRRHFAWWAKYNYVLSAALDAGVAVAVIIIFFCLQFPNNGNVGINTIQVWWGNSVFLNTADYLGTRMRTLAEGETFGNKANAKRGNNLTS